MDDILDVETGGMLEVWADLYGITKKPIYLELMSRYRRGRLFDALFAAKDVLTNKHANTTIPEAQGAARAYEVTGDAHWRDIVMAYWKAVVTDRGYYATGGQTSGENLDSSVQIVRPPGRQEPAALRCLQHDPARGLPVPLDGRRAVSRLYRAECL
jgi:DUF1680 family protein